jgi:hypothetical protein
VDIPCHMGLITVDVLVPFLVLLTMTLENRFNKKSTKLFNETVKIDMHIIVVIVCTYTHIHSPHCQSRWLLGSEKLLNIWKLLETFRVIRLNRMRSLNTQQKKMAQSHVCIQSKFPCLFLNQIWKNGEIWKEFEKMKKLNPILVFYLKPLRNGSKLKLVYQK